MRLHPLPPLLLLLLVWSQPAEAQGLFEQALEGELPGPAAPGEADAEDGAESPIGTASLMPGLGGLGRSWELGGVVRSHLFAGRAADSEDPELKSGQGELGVTLRARTAGSGGGFGELRLRSAWQPGGDTAEVALRQAYVEAFLGPLDLRVGRQIISWGKADGINPTDDLTPKDLRVWSPSAQEQRQPNLALRAWLSWASWRLELVGLPLFVPSHYPDVPITPLVALQPARWPGAELDSGVAAARLAVSSSLVDASVSYRVGPATLPGLAYYGLDLSQPAPVRAGWATYSAQTVGLDFATALGSICGLRGEAAWRMPAEDTVHPELQPLADVQAVLGVERQLFGELEALLQVHLRYSLDHEDIGRYLPTGTAGQPPDPRELAAAAAKLGSVEAVEQAVREEIRFQNRVLYGQRDELAPTLLLHLQHRALQDTLTLSLWSSLNLATEEWSLSPSVAYLVAEGLRVEVGAQVLRGPPETLLGAVEHQRTAGYVELSSHF